MKAWLGPVMRVAAAAQAAALISAIRMHRVRSFRDKFHELAFKASVRGPGTRYVRVYRGNGKRERRRRFLQDAHINQLNSHKPGTVQPRHIFGARP